MGISYMEDPGMEMGWGQKDDVDLKSFSLMAGINLIEWEKSKFVLEGDVAVRKFDEGNSESTGATLFWEKTLPKNAYLEIGVGGSYWFDSPGKDYVRRGMIAVVKYGFGFLRNGWKIGYRFSHSSNLLESDPGCNEHGATLQFEW
jgi:hypothetical protein